jgi:phosphodiesterase/alkaline phosphatase D-like protein
MPVFRTVWLTLLLGLVLLFGGALESFGAGGDLATGWSPYLDTNPRKQEAKASFVDIDGNLILAGYQITSATATEEYWTVKILADRSVAWRAALNKPGFTGQITSVVADSERNVIVSGFVSNGPYTDIYTVKYAAADGSVLWSHTFDGTAGRNDSAASVTVDASDNVYVGGYSQNTAGNYDYLLIKYAKSGPVGNLPEWHRTYGSATEFDSISAVVADASGVYATGQSRNGTDSGFLTIKYDSAGLFKWEKRYRTPGSANDSGQYVKIDSAGDVVVLGYVYQGGRTDTDIYAAKYSGATGTLTWESYYNGGMDDEPNGLFIEKTTDDVYLTGHSIAESSRGNFYTAKLNGSSGSESWHGHFSSGGDNTDIPTGIVVDSLAANAGAVYVTGYTESAGNYDFQTLKYKKDNGTLLWQSRYNNPVGRNDKPVGIGMAADGDVFVVGWSDVTGPKAGTENAATGGSESTILNGLMPWSDNQWAGYYVMMTGGQNKDLFREILSNSSTETSSLITVKIPFQVGKPITAGDTYYIYDKDDYDFLVVKYDRGVLNPPTDLKAETLSASEIKLTWVNNSPTLAPGFKIEKCLYATDYYTPCAPEDFDSANPILIPPGQTSHTEHSLQPDKYYYYQVKAYKDSDETKPSNTAYAVTQFVVSHEPEYFYSYSSILDNDDLANNIAVGPDNNPVVTGKIFGRILNATVPSFDYYTVKLNRSNLEPLWSQEYDDPESAADIGMCVTVDNNNQAIVSGLSVLHSQIAQDNIDSIFTIKYVQNPSPDPEMGDVEQWSHQYNGPGAVRDQPTAVASTTDSSNSIVVIGHGLSARELGDEDVYVIKYLTDGTVDWTADPAGIDRGGHDYPTAVAFDRDGNIIVTGYTQKAPPLTGTDYDIFTVKYCGSTSASCMGKTKGQIIWKDIYSGSGNGDDITFGLAVDGQGDVYVSGYTTIATGNQNYLTIKYKGSPTGGSPPGSLAEILWLKTDVDGPVHGEDQAVAVKVDPVDGNVVVAGTCQTTQWDNDFRIIRYNSLDGEVIWDKSVKRLDNDDYAIDMGMDEAGNVFVVGNTYAGSTTDIMSVKLNYLGDIVDAVQYSAKDSSLQDVHLNDRSFAIAVNKYGEAFIAGSSMNVEGNDDYITLKQSTTAVMPPAPFRAVPQSDYTKVNLSWSNNTPGSTFVITRNPGAVTIPLQAGTTSHVDTGLLPNTLYTYTIQAVSGSSSRLISTTVTTTLEPPAAPTYNVLSASAIDVSWSNLAGNTGYILERKKEVGGTWGQIPAPGSDLAADTAIYHDTGLSAGTTYYYRLKVKNASGTSLLSTESSVRTIPGQPTGVNVIGVTSTSINIGWTAVYGATSYTVERLAPDALTIPGRTGVSYADASPPLTSGKQYSYQVKAVNESGTSVASSTLPAKTMLITPTLGTPATASKTAINVTVTDPNNTPYNETGFTLEHALCSNSDPTQCNDPNQANWGGWIAVSPPASTASSFNYQVSGLAAGRTYRMRITALLSGANSAASSMVVGSTSISAPTNLMASNITNTALRLNWTDIYGETNYRVLVNGSELAGVNLGKDSNYYDVTGLIPGATYTFQVKPYYGSETDPTHWELSNLISQTMPADPTTLRTATAASTVQVNLTWDQVPLANKYRVERSPDAVFASPAGYDITAVDGLPASYSNNGLTAGTNYFYRVRYSTDNGASWSSYSNALSVTTYPSIPAFSGTNKAISTSEIMLTWSDVAGETGYELQFKGPVSSSACTEGTWPANGSGVFQPAGTLTYTYPAGTFVEGSKYCFRIRAYNDTADFRYSGDTAKPLTTLVAAPTWATTPVSAISRTGLTLTWNADAIFGGNGYYVERSSVSNFSSNVVGSAAATPSFPSSGLTSGTLYYYRVSTKNMDGVSGVVSTTQSVTTVPAIPTTLSVTATTTSNTFNWNNVIGETGYEQQTKQRVTASCDTEDWTGVSVTTSGADSTFKTYNGLTYGQVYCYRVRAYNASGGKTDSDWSSVQTKMTLLPAPTGLGFTSPRTESEINLYWTAVTGNKGYKLERSTDNVTWTQIATPLEGATTYKDNTGLSAGTLYYYRISVKNLLNDYSDPGVVQSARTVPVAPASVSMTVVSDNRIDIRWQVVPSATNYKIYRKVDSGTYGTALSDQAVPYATDYCGYPYPSSACPTLVAKSQSYPDTTVRAGKQYCYKLTAYNTSPYESVYSTEVCNTTPLAGPSLSITGYSSSTVQLGWTDVFGDEDGFELESKSGNGSWMRLALVPHGDVNAFTDTIGLQPATRYGYQVRSYKGSFENFVKGIDPLLWIQRGTVMKADGTTDTTSSTPPININTASGIARITPINGGVELYTTSPSVGTASKWSNCQLALINSTALVGDFDMQIDYTLPDPLVAFAQYHVYGRLQVNFPATAGGSNNAYVGRNGTNYDACVTVDGNQLCSGFATSDTIGKLRILRKGSVISTYVWSDSKWVTVYERIGASTATPNANAVTLTQYAQRNEIAKIKAIFDNFEVTTKRSAYSDMVEVITPAYTKGDNVCVPPVP